MSRLSKIRRSNINLETLCTAGESTPGLSGAFEVTVIGSQGAKLLHSKKGGQGFPDSPEKLQPIFSYIESELAILSQSA